MKISLTTYVASANGLTIVLTPETDLESGLVQGFGRHGIVKAHDGKLIITWDFHERKDGDS